MFPTNKLVNFSFLSSWTKPVLVIFAWTLVFAHADLYDPRPLCSSFLGQKNLGNCREGGIRGGKGARLQPLIENLRAWLIKNGAKGVTAEDSKTDIAILPSEELGIITKKPIFVGETIIKIPTKIIITEIDASKDAIPHADASWDVILAAWILREKSKGPLSFWHPYIDSLPSYVSLPQLYPDDILEQIDYQPVIEVIMEGKEYIQSQYNSCIPESIANASLEEFSWAISIVWSRSAYIQQQQQQQPQSQHHQTQTPLDASPPPSLESSSPSLPSSETSSISCPSASSQSPSTGFTSPSFESLSATSESAPSCSPSTCSSSSPSSSPSLDPLSSPSLSSSDPLSSSSEDFTSSENTDIHKHAKISSLTNNRFVEESAVSTEILSSWGGYTHEWATATYGDKKEEQVESGRKEDGDKQHGGEINNFSSNNFPKESMFFDEHSEEKSVRALIPYFDMFNHHFDTDAYWELYNSTDEGEYIGIVAVKDRIKGQGIHLTYFTYSSDWFFLGCGFVPKNNPYDKHAIFSTVEDIAMQVEKVLGIQDFSSHENYALAIDKARQMFVVVDKQVEALIHELSHELLDAYEFNEANGFWIWNNGHIEPRIFASAAAMWLIYNHGNESLNDPEELIELAELSIALGHFVQNVTCEKISENATQLMWEASKFGVLVVRAQISEFLSGFSTTLETDQALLSDIETRMDEHDYKGRENEYKRDDSLSRVLLFRMSKKNIALRAQSLLWNMCSSYLNELMK